MVIPEEQLCKDNDKGFALLEILGGLVVISLLMPLFWSYIEDYLNEMRNQSAAFHADAYNTAARTYIADNNARLHSGTLPATFTADELIRKGYLKGLNRSPFGQSYTTGIRRNTSTGRLEALTCSTGGEYQRRCPAQYRQPAPGLGGFIGKMAQQPVFLVDGQINPATMDSTAMAGTSPS